jgi:hypothetical protein
MRNSTNFWRYSVLPLGTVLGFSDPDGFDQLLLRCLHPNSGSTTFQTLALDDVNVQVTVPEPMSALFVTCAILLGRRSCGRSRCLTLRPDPGSGVEQRSATGLRVTCR